MVSKINNQSIKRFINFNDFSLFLFFSLFIASLSLSPLVFNPSKAYAAEQPSALLLVGKNCHELENLEHGFGTEVEGEGRVRVDTCSPGWQNILKSSLGCSGTMFYQHEFQTDPKDNSVTRTRWFTKLADYKACYNKALEKYEFLNSNACKTMRHGSDNWNKCEAAQNQMHAALGCDDRMFQDLKNGYWGVKPGALANCKSRIDAVGNVRIVVIRNGKKQLSDPIKSNTVSADPPENGGQGGGADASVNDVDCSGGGALGWIICPVFELGANMTQDVFDNIIRPMMEQVPVDTKGPFYAAWNNFRFLGNIVLIGAMLALVYAQARGGGR